MTNIYDFCPAYRHRKITLRQTALADAPDLLKCYSDEKSVPFFNSDNCNGDDFHYTTLNRMKQAIELWNLSYQRKDFVRWSVILNETDEKIGTVEMFHRFENDEFNHYGLLRIDLQSRFESEEIINDILEIANDHFYQTFQVEAILTKSFEVANQRTVSLKHNGYKPLGRKFMIYDGYFIRFQNSHSIASLANE